MLCCGASLAGVTLDKLRSPYQPPPLQPLPDEQEVNIDPAANKASARMRFNFFMNDILKLLVIKEDFKNSDSGSKLQSIPKVSFDRLCCHVIAPCQNAC